jgi:hypothetical protein
MDVNVVSHGLNPDRDVKPANQICRSEESRGLIGLKTGVGSIYFSRHQQYVYGEGLPPVKRCVPELRFLMELQTLQQYSKKLDCTNVFHPKLCQNTVHTKP